MWQRCAADVCAGAIWPLFPQQGASSLFRVEGEFWARPSFFIGLCFKGVLTGTALPGWRCLPAYDSTGFFTGHPPAPSPTCRRCQRRRSAPWLRCSSCWGEVTTATAWAAPGQLQKQACCRGVRLALRPLWTCRAWDTAGAGAGCGGDKACWVGGRGRAVPCIFIPSIISCLWCL